MSIEAYSLGTKVASSLDQYGTNNDHRNYDTGWILSALKCLQKIISIGPLTLNFSHRLSDKKWAKWQNRNFWTLLAPMNKPIQQQHTDQLPLCKTRKLNAYCILSEHKTSYLEANRKVWDLFIPWFLPSEIVNHVPVPGDWEETFRV